MSFEITGKIVKKYDIEAKTATFQTREFVIVTDETYPQYVKFQISQERVNLIESFQENDVVKVSFDLRGREWQGKYFTNLNAFRVVGQSSEAPPINDIPFEISDHQTDTDLPF